MVQSGAQLRRLHAHIRRGAAPRRVLRMCIETSQQVEHRGRAAASDHEIRAAAFLLNSYNSERNPWHGNVHVGLFS